MMHEPKYSAEDVSRLLDGDLSAEDAARLVGSAAQNPSLQSELEEIRVTRALVRQHAAQLAGGGETTRLRVGARFRAAVEAESWKERGGRPSSPFWNLSAWRPVLVTTLAAASVVGLYFLTPLSPGGPFAAPGAATPGDAEMSLLFDLHDAQGAPRSSVDMALQHHYTARAQAALLERADAAVEHSL